MGWKKKKKKKKTFVFLPRWQIVLFPRTPKIHTNKGKHMYLVCTIRICMFNIWARNQSAPCSFLFRFSISIFDYVWTAKKREKMNFGSSGFKEEYCLCHIATGATKIFVRILNFVPPSTRSSSIKPKPTQPKRGKLEKSHLSYSSSGGWIIAQPKSKTIHRSQIACFEQAAACVG